MEYLIGLVVLIIALFGYEKIKMNSIESLLDNTKEKDDKLKVSKEEVDKEIENIDRSIEAIKKNKKNIRDERLKKSDEEKADDWNG